MSDQSRKHLDPCRDTRSRISNVLCCQGDSRAVVERCQSVHWASLHVYQFVSRGRSDNFFNDEVRAISSDDARDALNLEALFNIAG